MKYLIPSLVSVALFYMLSNKSKNDQKIKTTTMLNSGNKSNPLNIRYSKSNKWVGQTGQLKGFVVFKSQKYGLRAAIKLIQNYIKNGNNTIEKIVSRWAPPNENDTKNYVEFVSKKTGLPKNYQIKNFADIANVLGAMSHMEGKPVPILSFYNAKKLIK